MKPVNFQTYKTATRMSLNEFNRWVTSIYKTAFADGLEEGEKEIPDDAVILSDDELFRKLQEIPGIGERTAAKIVAYIMTEGNV